MDRRKRVLALYLLNRRSRRQQDRQWWVHPINEERSQIGFFKSLFNQLCEDEKKFFNFFRMSKASFDELHYQLKIHLQRQDTNMRDCNPPKQMLAVTLKYLASGCTFTELHYTFRIGISTASKIVREVCQALWTVMRPSCIPQPSKERWEAIATGFEKNANFPHCIGAVDGKHIRITSPGSSMYFNYKEYHSIVLMAIADSSYRFVHADIGSYGKDCDSSVLSLTALWKAIDNDRTALPDENPLPASETPKIPYFLVGDEAFGLHKHLLRPYGGKNLSVEKKKFNYRLSRARRYVECAFGILSNKWRIFHRPINLEPDFVVDIVKACVVLHNIVRDHDGISRENDATISGLVDLPRADSVRGGLAANNIRQVMTDYFLSEQGSVPWQMSKI